jgi:hypothetical protein
MQTAALLALRAQRATMAVTLALPTKALLLPPLITSLTLLAMPPALALALA